MTLTEYREMLKLNGQNQRERALAKAKHDALLIFPTHPSYKRVQIDDEEKYVNIISGSTAKTKWIIAGPGDDLKIGSIVLYNSSHWLITERYSDNEIYVKGKLEICQKPIYWQDKDSLEIVSRWATIEKPYTSNITTNNMISYSSREFKIQMPFDENTSKINIGQRFMLEIINGEPKTYKVTSVDQMTGRFDYDGQQIGFLILNAEQDLYNSETDNVELMICDFKNPPSEDDPDNISVLEIKHTGDATIKNGGFGKKLYSYGGSGSPKSVHWKLSSDFVGAVPDFIHFENGEDATDGEECLVLCSYNDDLIGSTISITASNENSTVSLDLEVITL